MAWRKAYRVIFAVLLTALTVLLCAGAIRIWQEGAARQATDPLAAVYTPEIVEAQLLRVRPLLWAVAVMAEQEETEAEKGIWDVLEDGLRAAFKGGGHE